MIAPHDGFPFGPKPEPEPEGDLPEFETLDPAEMQQRARHLMAVAQAAGSSGHIAAICGVAWAVGAQICDRLEVLCEYEAMREGNRDPHPEGTGGSGE